MDLSSHLPPPDFYLSLPARGFIWEFIDVQLLSNIYASQPHSAPLAGMTAPLVTQGAGGGFIWTLETKLNPIHAFTNQLAEGSSVRREEQLAAESSRSMSTPWYDYQLIEQVIREDGPSPLLILHRPDIGDTTVALTQIDAEISMQQSVRGTTQRPSIIPLRMTLVERKDYKVRVF